MLKRLKRSNFKTDKERMKQVIGKWSTIKIMLEAEDFSVDNLDYGAHTCAFCVEYNLPVNPLGTCKRCPIMQETKEAFCKKTPFKDFETAADKYEDDNTAKNLESMKKACDMEIEFLEKLGKKRKLL